MAKQQKVGNKVKKDKDKDWKFTIETAEPNEVEIELDLLTSSSYEVDKLETETLPTQMPDKKPIRWFNNYSIQENKKYIKKKYNVIIPGLQSKLKEKNSRLVIYSDTHDPKLYYYEGTINGDTFELTDGDPANGMSP